MGLLGGGLLAGGERFDKGVHGALRLTYKRPEHFELPYKDPDMSDGGVHNTRGDRHGFGPQRLEDLFCGETPYAMFFKYPVDRGEANPAGFLRRGCTRPELQECFRGQIASERKEGRVVAPQLATEAMSESGACGGQLIGHTRPFPQLDNLGIQGAKCPQTIRIGAEGAGQYACVPAVILGACRRKTIPKAVQLFGIDGKDLKSAIQQTINDRAVRYLYGDGNLPGSPVPQPRIQSSS